MESRLVGDVPARTQIKNILSNPKLNKSSEYYVYLPYEITRKDRDTGSKEVHLESTIAARTAIYAITNFSLDECTTTIREILDEIKNLTKDKSTNPLIGKITNLNNSTKILSYSSLKELHECILEIKRHKVRDASYSELFTWVEGLYLNLDIQLKRQKIAESDLESAMLKMAWMEAEESLPVIFVILNEILRLNETTNDSHGPSKDALLYTLKMFTESNDVLYMSKGEQKNYLGAKKDVIIPELEKLLQQILYVRLNKDVVPQINELSNWFEGMYQHTATESKRLGIFARGKSAIIDSLLKATTGLTKAIIADYYHQAAKILNQMVKEFLQTEKEKVVREDTSTVSNATPSPKEKNNKHESIEEEQEGHTNTISAEEKLDDNQTPIKPSKPKSPPTKAKVEVSQHEQGAQLTISLSLADTNKIPELLAAINQVLTETVEEKFWKKLDDAARGTEGIKINALYNALHAFPEFEFSKEQKESLFHWVPLILECMAEYNGNTYLHGFIGSGWSEYLFPRANKDVADTITIQAEEKHELRKLILDLYVARRNLIKDRKSKELLGKINDLLLDIYTHLLDTPPLSVRSRNQMKNLVFLPQYADQPHTLFAKSVNMSIQSLQTQDMQHTKTTGFKKTH